MEKRKERGRNGPPCMEPTIKFFIFQLAFRAKTNIIIDGK